MQWACKHLAVIMGAHEITACPLAWTGAAVAAVHSVSKNLF